MHGLCNRVSFCLVKFNNGKSIVVGKYGVAYKEIETENEVYDLGLAERKNRLSY